MRSSIARAWVALLLAPACALACWDEAGQRYGVSPHLLHAIAEVESDLNPQALNLTHRERTNTYDVGLMQINSSNLAALARHGIRERDLLDPCINIHVGAWLLAHAFRHAGFSWNGVGAYNAACTQLKGPACEEARARYAWKVYRRLHAASLDHARHAAAVPARHLSAQATRGSP